MTSRSRLSRRSLVTGSAAVLAAPRLALAAPRAATPASGDADILIVGAGAAGIAAARRIAAAGQRFILVEATDHVGGRCVTDTSTFGVPFDRGAHWIHTPDTNPLARLATGTGLEVYRAPFAQRVRIGRRNARESELEDYLSSVVRANRAIAEAARGRADVACARAFPADLGDWRPTVEFVLGPYAFGTDVAELSAVDVAKSAERDVDAFCRQGFGALLARIAEGVPVRLSSPVTRLDHSGRGGRVEALIGNSVVRARYAIVTVSTNVLTSGAIEFVPELPKRQLDAARQLRLGSYDHIGLELPGNPLGLRRDDLVFEKSNGPRTAALLANVSGTPLSVVSVAGRFGRELSAKGEAAMIEFALEWLSGLYGSEVRAAVRRTAATRWNDDPWTRGAMSAAVPGGQGARRILMEPVRDRLYFAGEAVHETLWGTVAGAWESGERAAEAILRRMGVLRPPAEPKRETPPRRRRRRR